MALPGAALHAEPYSGSSGLIPVAGFFSRLGIKQGRARYIRVAWSVCGGPWLREDEREKFEQAFLPHLPTAYNLARWLMRDEQEAEDMVQEAYLRALKSFAGFHGTDGRGWLLAIVRNTCYSRLRRQRAHGVGTPFVEEIHGATDGTTTPAALLMQKEERQSVQQAMEELPVEYREVIVLRELEGLAYKEIAAALDISIGTVMSRLARGRALLQRRIKTQFAEEP